MSKGLSRRNFLKGGAGAVAGLAAGAVSSPGLALSAGKDELCTVLDLAECIGCEECVIACRETWQDTVPDPVQPIPQPFPKRVPIEDWSQRKDVSDRLTPYNFLYVEHLEYERKGEYQELNIPRRCMHCLNPPCTNLCPFGAGRVESNGVVHIDPDVCLGGAKCRKTCPWHIPQRQSGVGIYLDMMPSYAGNGVMFKCHRCLPLVKQGKTPRCIEVCPQNVQSMGPRPEMVAKATALAKKRALADGASEEDWGHYVYGLEENGGTNTLYVSPIPFEQVNQLIAQQSGQGQGKGAGQGQGAGQGAGRRADGSGGGRRMRAGRPGMGPVANSMASAENLTWALVAGPVAGAAAGALKLFSRVKKFTGTDTVDGPDA